LVTHKHPPTSESLEDARATLEAFISGLAERFWAGEDIERLVGDRAVYMDALLRDLWQRIDWRSGAPDTDPDRDIGLFAVGGYGRGELHPYSDIDLLILVRGEPARYGAQIEVFIQQLWDLNLNVGHSVRSTEQCRCEAAADITVATTLLERRPLLGPIELDRNIGDLFANDEIWPSAKFFRAKRDEQRKRHKRFQNVEYDLEPNIKGAPGGLRDIQTINWIIKRHIGSTSLKELIQQGYLTQDEGRVMTEGRRFLWRVRFGLHLLAGRAEDRLLFDYQRTLAERLGYQDSAGQLAVEQFMHTYYRHVLALREVNDILLQHFDETILRAHYTPVMEPLNQRFQLRDNYIEVTSEQVFEAQPSALIEMFVIMANRRDIAGVRASTIRLIRNSLYLITDTFRHAPQVTELFIQLLKAPYTLVSQLTRMRRYGILGLYIPEFGRIIGQMQHDLFHIYTVDAHTMMVIRNMRMFRYRASRDRYPVAAHCVKAIPKIELLYIAGLYHDIGKGRGGNHSELGARDVINFCQRHRLSEADTDLVAWLVREHLSMSSVAQRKDIHDPEEILQFAHHVGSETRLDYLYALTVADITATNPTLWNSWRATLMRHLYNETRKALRRGLESPLSRDRFLEQTTASTVLRLKERGITPDRAAEIWEQPDPEFFLQHTPVQIAAITEAIDAHDLADGPLVLVRDIAGQVLEEGATEIFIYAHDQPNLFAVTTQVLDQLGLSIQGARIHTTSNGHCFNSFMVLDESGMPIANDPERKATIRDQLVRQLGSGDLALPSARRRIPRRLQQFQIVTQPEFLPEEESPYTAVRIIAADRPGLLARIATVFVEYGLKVHRARITTLGEKVEDLFYLSDSHNRPIRDPALRKKLVDALRRRLDRESDEPVH